jgi:GntR family transcriptional regulator, galactonate operon transcriptional repressor
MAELGGDLDRGAGYSMRGLQARVIDGVGRQIVGGQYAPGDLLPKEAELTEQFGVSRTSVREGMRVLAAKGLVDIRQKIGTRVRQPENWNVFDSDILRWHSDVGRGDEIMRNLVEVRQIMEPAAARLAAGRASMDDLRRMDDALADMVANSTNRESYAHADVEFHLAVYAASHNVLLRQFGSVIAVAGPLAKAPSTATPSGGAEHADDITDHEALAAAIRSRQASAAADVATRLSLAHAERA